MSRFAFSQYHKFSSDNISHLGRGLEELDVVLPGDLLAPLLGDHPLVLHVALVPQDHPLHVLVGVLVNVPQPLGDVVKALCVGDVVHQHDPHSSAIIACCDCMEPEGIVIVINHLFNI